MLVKDLKKLLEGLDESRDIEINICEEEKVVSRSGEFLELGDYGEVGYVLEFKDGDGYDDEGERDFDDVDEEDFDDIS